MSRFPQIGDNQDAMVELLAIIAQNTGGLGDLDPTSDDAAPSGVRTLRRDSLVWKETADLDGANADGSITLEPGQEITLAEHSTGGIRPLALLAVGAIDEDDAQYAVKLDGDTVGSWTNSPLGLINDPFSFIREYRATIIAARRIGYAARLPSDAAGPIDLAARIHVEEL